jgi:type II secretory pathway component PulF
MIKDISIIEDNITPIIIGIIGIIIGIIIARAYEPIIAPRQPDIR